jgi:hypothetical protein
MRRDRDNEKKVQKNIQKLVAVGLLKKSGGEQNHEVKNAFRAAPSRIVHLVNLSSKGISTAPLS